MPPSPSRGLTVTEIRKFIPQSWKQTSPRPIPETHHESVSKSFGHFIAHGHLYEAFRAFSLLLHQSCSYKFVLESASSLLSACVEFNEFFPGQQIHAHCISSGFEFDPVLVPKLVTFYSAFNLIDEAQFITESSDVLCPLPWNVLIDSYVRNKRFEEAVYAYKRMVSKGIRPDGFTYTSVLKSCGALLDFESGRVVHGNIEVSSHGGSLYVCNALISMYKRFGKVEIARKLFEMMCERDAVSWNVVINCYASLGDLDEAHKLFLRMDVEATVVTWNTLAGGYLQIGNYVEALKVVVMMRNGNVSLDSVALINGLKACSHIGVIRWGQELHCLAIRCCYDQIDNVRNSLITMYSRCDYLRDALKVFLQIEANNLSTWNSIISGYAHNERSNGTSFLLREMLLAGFHPNYVTLASILPLCAKVANLKHGKELHCYILRRQSFKDCLILWNSVIDMYSKSGKMVAAKRVYDSMRKRDKVTYTSLIDGYGMMGKGETALAWFNHMIRSGIEPDHVTMVAVLSACSHSNLLRKGEIMFNKMQSVFGIHPRLEHYSCMVDIYCRAGNLATARDIIRKIRYEPTSAMCATLVIACLVRRNKDIGEWAADKLLLEMEPKKFEHYVLLKDMYRACGSLSKLAVVKKTLMSLQKADYKSDGLYMATMVDDSVGTSSINQEQSSDEEQHLVQVG